MSPREKRKDRRDWRSGLRRKVALTTGWLFLLSAIAGASAYFAFGSSPALLGAVAAAGVAMLVAGTGPEVEERAPQRLVFSPARRDSEPSLVRQLLTLP